MAATSGILGEGNVHVHRLWHRVRGRARILVMRSVAIREAGVADAAGIARVGVDSGRTTYKGIMPDEYLANIDVLELEQERRRQLENPGGEVFWYVADHDGRVVGWAVGGRCGRRGCVYAGGSGRAG